MRAACRAQMPFKCRPSPPPRERCWIPPKPLRPPGIPQAPRRTSCSPRARCRPCRPTSTLTGANDMGTAVAVAVDLLVELLKNAGQISQLIQTAQANGQTMLTPEQWATIVGADDSAETALAAAIATAKSQGR